MSKELLQKAVQELKDLESKIQDPTLRKSFEAEWSDLHKGLETAKEVTTEAEEKKISDNTPEAMIRAQKRLKDKEAIEAVQKDEMCKDDTPHAPGSPEDSAHDVVEENSPMQAEMEHLSYAWQKKKYMEHLRSLKDPSNLRSKQNEIIGKD